MSQRWFMTGGVVALTLGAFLAGMLASGSFSGAPPTGAAGEQAVEQLFDQPFPDLDGHPVTLARWRGKPLVVNFWATWCPPCLAEMPGFSRLQKRHPEVQFVGIAADTDSNVRAFSGKMELSYPILLGSDGATGLMAKLGNNRNALPFTVTFDASGRPRHLRLGAIDEAEAERLIGQLTQP